MSLVIALFLLLPTGCWLYSLTDVALTPAVAFRGRSKGTWFVIVALTFIVGAIAWLMVRRAMRVRVVVRGSGPDDLVRGYRWLAADDAVARHPAGQSRALDVLEPRGPDDDPDFLAELDRLIHGEDFA
jgi:hypothetical protein